MIGVVTLPPYVSSMPGIPTVADSYKLKRLTDDYLTSAVAGYLADPTPGPREIAAGITLDIAAAVLAMP